MVNVTQAFQQQSGLTMCRVLSTTEGAAIGLPNPSLFDQKQFVFALKLSWRTFQPKVNLRHVLGKDFRIF